LDSKIFPNMSFPQGETCGSHSEGRKAVEETMHAAAVMQEEIAFLNRIADAQSLRRGKPPTLQRQPERNWRRLAFGMLDLPPLEALKIVRALSTEAEEQLPRLFTAIKAECCLANFSGNYGVSSYCRKMWQGFRSAAMEKIEPDRFEQVVSETEIMLETGRLHEWKPERVEIQASPEVVAAELAPLLTATPEPKAAAAAPTPAAKAAAGASTAAASGASTAARTASGRLVYRPSAAAAAVAPNPAAAAAASGLAAASTAGLSGKDLAAMAELQAERERLERLLRETRESLSEREAFLSQSEAKLMETTQAQIEREVELEQREEELRELERRYREFQVGGLASPPPEGEEPSAPAKVSLDEFKD